MTRRELVIAANAARTYPSGHGYDWGLGPLTDLSQGEAAKVLERQPWLAAYG